MNNQNIIKTKVIIFTTLVAVISLLTILIYPFSSLIYARVIIISDDHVIIDYSIKKVPIFTYFLCEPELVDFRVYESNKYHTIIYELNRGGVTIFQKKLTLRGEDYPARFKYDLWGADETELIINIMDIGYYNKTIIPKQ